MSLILLQMKTFFSPNHQLLLSTLISSSSSSAWDTVSCFVFLSSPLSSVDFGCFGLISGARTCVEASDNVVYAVITRGIHLPFSFTHSLFLSLSRLSLTLVHLLGWEPGLRICRGQSCLSWGECSGGGKRMPTQLHPLTERNVHGRAVFAACCRVWCCCQSVLQVDELAHQQNARTNVCWPNMLLWEVHEEP